MNKLRGSRVCWCFQIHRIGLEGRTVAIHNCQSKVKIERCSKWLWKEGLQAGLLLHRLVQIRLTFIIDDLPNLKMVLKINLSVSWQGKRQVLDRHLKSTPESILDAIDGAGCEDFELHVLRQWVLGLASTHIWVSRDLDIILPSVILTWAHFLDGPRQGHLLLHLFILLVLLHRRLLSNA